MIYLKIFRLKVFMLFIFVHVCIINYQFFRAMLVQKPKKDLRLKDILVSDVCFRGKSKKKTEILIA